ncbi:MAG: DUF3021 family protein [Butyrivibrio sp.]|nr:DUF3021 family protein [Butyrivibrio sp.]
MKAFISEFLKWFIIINTGIMLIVWINIFKYDTIWVEIIPQIFCASLLTSLVTTAFFSINPKKPLSMLIRVLIQVAHYLVLCIIIMTLGTLFDWFELTLSGCAGVVLSVAGVYLIAAVISYLLSKSEADEMTKALKDFKD